MVFSLTSSCTVAHLPSIAAASGADCPSRRRRGIAQHRAELLTALVQQIAALPFVAAMLAAELFFEKYFISNFIFIKKREAIFASLSMKL
jgi:hypothetical protein